MTRTELLNAVVDQCPGGSYEKWDLTTKIKDVFINGYHGPIAKDTEIQNITNLINELVGYVKAH